MLFGPQKIAGLGAGLGKAVRDFKDAMSVAKSGDAHARASPAKGDAPGALPGKPPPGEDHRPP